MCCSSRRLARPLLCLARQGRMADGDTPEIASATLYVPGEHVADAAVQGVAVGEPVARQPSDKAESARFQPPPEDSVAGEPAEGVLYSALSAKFFARFDLDRDGEIDVDELRSALKQLELDDVDAAAAMSTFVRWPRWPSNECGPSTRLPPRRRPRLVDSRLDRIRMATTRSSSRNGRRALTRARAQRSRRTWTTPHRRRDLARFRQPCTPLVDNVPSQRATNGATLHSATFLVRLMHDFPHCHSPHAMHESL